MISFGNSNNSRTTATTFQSHLDAYTYPVFHSKGDDDTSHRDFVASFATNPYYTGTRLFLPPNHNHQTDPLVLKALLHKKPVYWGGDKDDMTNWDAVEAAFGYNKETTNTLLTSHQVSATRYAVAGPMRVMAHDDLPERDARAVHVWAPNLESTGTADYDTIINRNTVVFEGQMVHDTEAINKAYYDRFLELWNLIFHSATYSLTSGQQAYIQSALLGAGCFIKGCPDQLRNELLKTQFRAVRDALAQVAATAEQDSRILHLKMCIYTPQDFPDEVVQMYRDLADYCDNFSVGEGPDEGNVLANLYHDDPYLVPVVVNAGDPLSFIGNGQSKDFTVEGFMVANAGGFNPQFRNTSFLHNTRFNPELLVPENWIRTSH